MATNQNNVHINSFTKGMNTDTSLDMISNEQYVFGQNIRINNETLLGKDYDSNSKKGIVSPVAAGKKYYSSLPVYYKILATASIGDTGIVIIKYIDDTWSVYRVLEEDGNIKYKHVFTSVTRTNAETFSVLLNKEQEDILKLYIADGEHEIMCVDINKEYHNVDIDQFISNHMYPKDKVRIVKKIPGKLKTQQVQYAYRYYVKNGIHSKLSPLTNKIQIINNSRSKEIGNAEDTLTSIGLQLQINRPTSFKMFDRLQVYRMSYYKHNNNCEINLIFDAKVNDTNTTIINDNGIESLQELSIEEFSSLSGLNIIPQSIEQNQNYMFASNVIDNTMLKKNTYDPSDFIAYSHNKSKQYVLYADSKYERVKTFSSISEITEDYYINKYSDINIGDSEKDPCRYAYIDGNLLLGGEGKKIRWNFVTTEIDVHQRCNIDSNQLSSSSYNTVPQSDSTISGKFIYNLSYNTTSNKIDITENNSVGVYKYLDDHKLPDNISFTYDDMFTSSMFRSLKRDEVYRYGIVIYDKYGKRSNVYWIADVRTPSEQEFPSVQYTGNVLKVRPIGVRFYVDLDKEYTYQIVRCQKTPEYTKNMLQCVLSRPIRQPLYDSGIKKVESETATNTGSTQKSPYYPQQFLSTNFYTYYCNYDNDDKYLGKATNINNKRLFQIFNPQINVQREDLLQQLSSVDLSINPISFMYGASLQKDGDKIKPKDYMVYSGIWFENFLHVDEAYIDRQEYLNREPLEYNSDSKTIKYKYSINATLPFADYDGRPIRGENEDDAHGKQCAIYKKYKEKTSNIFYYYNKILKSSNPIEVDKIADVKNPTWDEGWDNLQIADGYIQTGSKTYKGFTSNIGEFEYVNWVCSNLYDLQVGTSPDSYSIGNGDDKHSVYTMRITLEGSDYQGNHQKIYEALGCQGPGPVCFLLALNKEAENNDLFSKEIALQNGNVLNGSLLCNIQHSATQFAGITKEEKQYDVYYGFGNYSNKNDSYVFDGDVYILPCEFVTMFKTYDFNSKYSLQSSQFVYYVPMETTINTFFDYGMNYRNTQSKNLQLEPGEIVGIAVQDRPITQYNLVYSDNNTSNDVFNTEALDESQDNYPQRIHYSELKTNGEQIDSWGNFKASDYIDCDTRYGGVTHLLTDKDILYFWQAQAFGRLTVNERSLVKDQNSNTIQLGQGGVLQRTDYINTKYGIRMYDRSAISYNDAIYWIDVLNKAILQSNGQQVINYSTQANVQNIANEMTDDIPQIDIDVQHGEILCKCLNENRQLIFNANIGVATSIYTRGYDNIIYLNNTIYGIQRNSKLSTTFVETVKYNFLNNDTDGYLTPTNLTFCVNPNSSTTKVYDNQEIVTLNRGDYNGDDTFMNNKQYKFNTNLYQVEQNPIGNTDREGNVRYSIPRIDGEYYGNRIRGKWMEVVIIDNKPRYENSISHILTKYRQSFS